MALLTACTGGTPPTVAPASTSTGYGYAFDVDSASEAAAALVPTSLPLGPGGRLYSEAISGIVRVHFGALLTCYYAGLTRDPKLAGLVTVQYVFSEDGVPKEVIDGGSTLPDKAVIDCILEKFRNLRYPASKGGDVKVLYPMQFAPGDLASSQPTK
jgi:hypothetical protein